MAIDFDEDKWNAILSQWEGDDNAEAADALESDKDAMDLADPKTWADQDAAAAGARGAPGLAREAAESTPIAPTRLRMPDAPTDEPPPMTRPAQKPVAPPPMAAEPPKPPPPPESLDWKGLSDRLTAAQLAQGTSRGYENMFANIGAQSGYRPNPHAGDVGVNMVRGEMDIAKAKRDDEAKAGAAKVKAAMDDPNSLQSQKAREALRAQFPGIKLPTSIDNWSANDIQRWLKTGDLARLDANRAANEDRDAKALAAKTAAEQKAAKEAAQLENSRKALSKVLIDAGFDPSTASPEDIKHALQIRQQNISDKNADATRALAVAGEERKKGEAEALKGDIPFAGSKLRYTGPGTPREDDRREAQKAAAGYGAAIAGMDDMSNRLAEFAKSPSPATKSALESAARLTAGHLNTAYGQGAMSIDEAREMAKTLGASFDKVSGFQFVLDKMMGDDPAAAEVMLRRLKAARQNTMASALAKAKAYRYEPEAGAGSIKMKFPDGSVHDVPPEKLEKAKTKGGVPVNG